MIARSILARGLQRLWKKPAAGGVSLLFAAFILGLATPANAVVVNWTGPNDFNDASITFSGFQADTLVFASDNLSSDASWHNHGLLNETITVDLLLDAVWTNIVTDQVNVTINQSLLPLLTGISFGSATVSGIRFNSLVGVNQTFHGFDGLRFTFEQVAAVPEPSTLALIAAGLAGLGLMGWRRRKV